MIVAREKGLMFPSITPPLVLGNRDPSAIGLQSDLESDEDDDTSLTTNSVATLFVTEKYWIS